MQHVTIYSSPGCGYCIRVKALLSSLAVPFEERSVVTHPEEVRALSNAHNWRTVPMVLIGDEFVGGYDDITALHERGELAKKLA